MTPDRQRLALFGLSTAVIVAGVGVSFGIGAALIVAGIFGAVVAVAWAYIAVSSA